MKRVKVLWAAMAALLAVAGPGVAPAQTASDLAAVYARELQALVGTDHGEGLVVRAVWSEGAVVVILMDGPAQWRTGISGAELSRSLLEGLCETGPGFFTGGLQLRVDSVELHANRQAGPIETSCPPAS